MDQGLDFQIQVEASECKGRGVEPGEALSLSLGGGKKKTNKQGPQPCESAGQSRSTMETDGIGAWLLKLEQGGGWSLTTEGGV